MTSRRGRAPVDEGSESSQRVRRALRYVLVDATTGDDLRYARDPEVDHIRRTASFSGVAEIEGRAVALRPARTTGLELPRLPHAVHAAYRPPSGARPCGQCPFRRAARAGWLGLATPQSFIVEISMERPLPCHPTIDYEDPSWLDDWTAQEVGRICAGSLIMAANMGKIPRDPAFPRLPSDDDEVFGNHLEFIQHHEGAEVRSWEMHPGSEREVRSPTKRREESEMSKVNKTAKTKATKATKTTTGRKASPPRRTSSRRTRTPARTTSEPAQSPTLAPPPATDPRDAYIQRVRQALQLRDEGELTKQDYASALQDLRFEVDGMCEAALEELGERIERGDLEPGFEGANGGDEQGGSSELDEGGSSELDEEDSGAIADDEGDDDHLDEDDDEDEDEIRDADRR